MRARILRHSAHSFSFDDSIIEGNMVRNALVRFDMAHSGISMGNKGFVYICRAVCEERKETTGSVSCILLLPDFRLAHSAFLDGNSSS